VTSQTHEHAGPHCWCLDPVTAALGDPDTEARLPGAQVESASAPRPTPCATCPYRENVPSGVWAPEEYEKLPRYDADIADQPQAVFMCHQQDGCVCAGWLGHRDPRDLLAVRIGIITGSLDPACADYSTDVPLFPTGADAAAHGAVGVDEPGPRAAAAIEKLLVQRTAEAGRRI
jgi:hypothetical protein